MRVLHGARLKFYFILVDYRYPNDAEKHLLALKSGLTRSQVLVTLDVKLMFFIVPSAV